MAIIDAMKNSRLKRTARPLVAMALVSGAPLVFAANLSWTAGDGAWENAANWSGGALPTADDFVDITHPGAITSSATANLAKELLNKSALTVNAGKLAVTGTVDTFAALAVNGGAALEAGRIFMQSGGALKVSGAGTAVEVAQGVFNSGDWRMSGSTTLRAESFDNFASLRIAGGAAAAANSMINHTDANALVTGAGSVLAIHGDLTNDGLFQVEAGGELNTHSIDNKGVLAVDQGRVQTDSQINAGTLTLSGASAQYRAEDVVTNNGSFDVSAGASASIDTLDNHAVIKVDGAQLSGQNFNNELDGELLLSNGASVSFGDVITASRFGISIDGVDASVQTVKFQQLSGTTLINGGTLGASDTFGVQFAGGELLGHGNIDGKLVLSASGVLTPGDTNDATQRFAISDGLALLGGLFAVDLGGTSVTDYDLLDVQGAASLGGTLQVSLLSGYVPTLGDAFDIILADSITGAFGNILLPTLGDGLKFTSINGGSFFRLQVAAVPLPAPALLFGGALGVLGLAARRRQRL